MRKYSKFVILVGILAFVLMFFLAFPGYSSTNNLPAAVGGTVMVNSNGLVSAPSGFYASNGLALDNPPVLIFDETFEGWGTADGMTWTNGTGWTSTAEVTNGICNLETHNLLSPWITGRGISGISVTWSNLVELAGVVEYTTNDADWVQLDTLSDIRISSDGYRLRVSVVESVPGIGDSIALLDRLTVWGHQFPTRIGGINDYAGIAIRVDNPVGNRDAVNLQTLNSRLAAYIAGGESAVGWSRYPASNIVDLAGNTLQLDPRYSISVVGDTISFTCGGSTMFDITGSSNYTPRIVSFRVSGSNLMAGVVGRIGRGAQGGVIGRTSHLVDRQHIADTVHHRDHGGLALRGGFGHGARNDLLRIADAEALRVRYVEHTGRYGRGGGGVGHRGGAAGGVGGGGSRAGRGIGRAGVGAGAAVILAAGAQHQQSAQRDAQQRTDTRNHFSLPTAPANCRIASRNSAGCQALVSCTSA